ncbi:MAG: SCO family protein [Gammaproteobacteria bacterium]
MLILGLALPLASLADGLARYSALAGFGGEFELTDHHGETFSLADARGKVVLIAFGFTTCASVCPLTLNELAATMKVLGPEADRVLPVFVSVDPVRDTPSALREYVTYFHPSIVGLTGSQDQLRQVARQYRAPFYVRRPDEYGEYVVDHSSKLFVVDGEGTLANILRLGTHPDQVARVVRGLLDG